MGNGRGGFNPPDPESGFFAFFDFFPFFGFTFGLIILLPIILLLIGIAIGIWVYEDAEARGEEGVVWLLIVLIANIFGLIIWLVVRPKEKKGATKTKTDTKFCPNCGTEVNADANYCENCGEEL